MKKNKVNKIVTLSIIGVLVVVAVTIFILNFTKDSSSFSLLEKKWISDNINNVIDVSVYFSQFGNAGDIPLSGPAPVRRTTCGNVGFQKTVVAHVHIRK